MEMKKIVLELYEWRKYTKHGNIPKSVSGTEKI